MVGTSRQSEILRELAHRPWSLPDRHWFMGQTWERQLFAHWRLAPQTLAPLVPPQLPIDIFDGHAWLGITPFRITGLRLRGTPPIPYLSSFPELNVRTYVTVENKPGIYFFSLDAGRRLAVIAARRAYRLPYFKAEMRMAEERGRIVYSSRRTSSDGPAAQFAATYRSLGSPVPASPGTLDHWLCERYCLYTLDDRRRVWRGDIHHPPWLLQPAEAEIEVNTMAAPLGLSLEGEPLLHFAFRQDVAIWRIDQVGE